MNRIWILVAIILAVIVSWMSRSLKNDLSIYHTADWWNPESSFSILHRMNKIRVPYFVRHLNRTEGPKKFIDIGCGGGLVTEAIASQSNLTVNITGYDISQASLDKAIEHGSGIPGLNYQYGSMYAIPLSDSSVDGVIVSDILEHLETVPVALDEIFRVLKPGGVVVFDTIARTNWSWLTTYFVAQELLGIVHPGAHDWRLFINPEELEVMLTQAGFKTDKSEWLGICAEISPMNAWNKQSMYQLIESFYEDKNDLSSSYMGYAIKPPL